MIETLHTISAFVVAIALLIAVHEYGHFIVARKLGIKVEKFSIGFGPALFSWRSRDREVEYIIAAIPLGGYVKMLGENPDEQHDEAKQQLSDEDRARAFDAQPVWKRAAVAVAGPGFNFLFAIVVYMLIGWIGQLVMPPVIGAVTPASVAERSGILVGDRIARVQETPVHSWQQVEEILKQQTGSETSIDLDRNGLPVSVHVYLPQVAEDPLLVNVADQSLGINPGMKVLVDSVIDNEPASRAGLVAGDVILQVEGVPVVNIRDFIEVIRANTGKHITLIIQRSQTLLNISLVPEAGGDGSGRIGARMAAQAVIDPELYRMGLWEGIEYGFGRTWEMTSLTLQVLGKMVTATISPDTLGGPIAIAQLAGKTAELGMVAFLTFLALISVNLAVLNLLPIPVLDGGHLVYLGIEKVLRRPLSPRMLERTQIVGMALIIMLMVFAFYNDLSRLFRG
ncbi:MAG: RIP metalloprotease RseP [Mariprofundaceae bacterium]